MQLPAARGRRAAFRARIARSTAPDRGLQYRPALAGHAPGADRGRRAAADCFYYYDTVAASGADLKHRTFRVDNPHEHRGMLATLLKHSRYFIANRSYVNKPEFTAGRDEISARFYEGAAAGTVMIGEAPRTEEFKQQFDWPDAVIHLPFDSPDIGRILADLNGDPERLRAVRRNNVREAAQRHDWLHRILAGVRYARSWRRPKKCRLARNGSTQIASNALEGHSDETGSQRETIDSLSAPAAKPLFFREPSRCVASLGSSGDWTTSTARRWSG